MPDFSDQNNNKIIDFAEYKTLKDEIKKFNEDFFDEFNRFVEFDDEEISTMLNKKDED